MTNFKAGQKVVYIGKDKDYPQKQFHVIERIGNCRCGKEQLDCGYPLPVSFTFTSCLQCGKIDASNVYWKMSEMFRPLQYDSNINMEVIALFQPTEEKSDCPVHVPEKLKV